jgi:hypothetical protein
MSRDELLADVRLAVELAREALEQDAAEARTRGRGGASPDAASVSALAAGILVSNAIQSDVREREPLTEASRAKSPRSSRRAAAMSRAGRSL